MIIPDCNDKGVYFGKRWTQMRNWEGWGGPSKSTSEEI